MSFDALDFFTAAGFKKSSDWLDEIWQESNEPQKVLNFGISYLDHATGGIRKNDLILLGSPSGLGKTQLCTNIAAHNVNKNHRVAFFSLEAEPGEIEKRMVFKILSDCFYNDPDRPRVQGFDYSSWITGAHAGKFEKYREFVTDFFKKTKSSLFTQYKLSDFTIETLAEKVTLLGNHAELIIVDHVHYLDWDDDNDNRAIKTIAKTARSLALDSGTPILLVSHLRKKDRNDKSICADLEDFHGSSDLYKIATKVITMGAGAPLADGKFTTFFRVPKNRINGGVTRYVAKTTFDVKRGDYEPDYEISISRGEFTPLAGNEIPYWAEAARRVVRDVDRGKVFNPSDD